MKSHCTELNSSPFILPCPWLGTTTHQQMARLLWSSNCTYLSARYAPSPGPEWCVHAHVKGGLICVMWCYVICQQYPRSILHVVNSLATLASDCRWKSFGCRHENEVFRSRKVKKFRIFSAIFDQFCSISKWLGHPRYFGTCKTKFKIVN